jgi:Leucine-rich repeat (LRR) protein
VLNASKNSLTHIEGIARLSKLKALILNDNKLKRIPHLAKLSELNTLGIGCLFVSAALARHGFQFIFR